jgi:hypothetical protein
MPPATKLLLIKLLHTAILVFFNIVIFFFLYAVITNRLDVWMWIALGLIAAECLVLLVFNRICPVTIVARKYSNSKAANFDIFLPEWLAKYNKEIYGTIVAIGLVVLVWRLLG